MVYRPFSSNDIYCGVQPSVSASCSCVRCARSRALLKGSKITGYQVQYSLKKNFSSKKTVTVSKAATTKVVIKKLKSKKTYYVRIRAYKKVKGKKYYSAWSKAKTVKVK